MSDVSISYKGAEIASLDDSGTKTLLTQGKYCEDDIEVAYTKPSGGGIELIVDNTATADVSTINILIPSDKQNLGAYAVVLTGQLSANEWIYPKINSTNASTTGVYFPQKQIYTASSFYIAKNSYDVTKYYICAPYNSVSSNSPLQNILLNLYGASNVFKVGFNVKVYGVTI